MAVYKHNDRTAMPKRYRSDTQNKHKISKISNDAFFRLFQMQAADTSIAQQHSIKSLNSLLG